MAVVILAACASSAEPAATASRAPAPQPAGTGADESRTLYYAAISIAEASLRLHETDRAKEWLSRAPAEHRGWEWRYLAGVADRSAAAIELPGGTIADATVGPDGRLLAVAMADGRVHLLDTATRTVIRTLEGHTASAWTPVFTADGQRLATASSDGTARIWDVATGRDLRVMSGNGRGAAAVAWSPDETRLAIGSWDFTRERGVWGTLNVYDAATGERVRHVEHGGYPIASLTYTRDGARLIGGTWDWDLVIWDTETFALPRVLPPPPSQHYKRVEDFALSPDGSRLAVAYADNRVRIWDLDRHEVVQTLHSPTEGIIKNIADVAWLPDGDRLVTVGGDLTVRLWDAATADLLATHHGHERPILTIAVSPDGQWVWSGGADGLRVWDLDALDPVRAVWRIPRSAETTQDGGATAYDIAFDPTGGRAVVTTFEGWLRILDARTGREVRGWRASDEATVGVDWSPDGRWIASADNDGSVVVWDATNGARVIELLEAGRQLLDADFSPDGSTLAAPGADSSLVVWRVPLWEPIATLAAGSAAVQEIAWQDDATFAATYDDGKVRLWDAGHATLRSVIDAGERGTPAIAFDPSRTRLAVALGRSVRIRDLETDRWIAEWTPRSGSARSIAWAADGERIAAALSGNTFEVWDARSGETVLRLPQTASAWLTTWTADDLVLVPLDETIRIFRTEGSD